MNRIPDFPESCRFSLRNTHKVKRILYEHPVFCGVTRVHAPRRSPVYMNKRTQARRQWTEHYSALQETSAWCIDRGWPHVIEWVTSHSFQRESYVTLGCILRGASTKIFPSLVSEIKKKRIIQSRVYELTSVARRASKKKREKITWRRMIRGCSLVIVSNRDLLLLNSTSRNGSKPGMTYCDYIRRPAK